MKKVKNKVHGSIQSKEQTKKSNINRNKEASKYKRVKTITFLRTMIIWKTHLSDQGDGL